MRFRSYLTILVLFALLVAAAFFTLRRAGILSALGLMQAQPMPASTTAATKDSALVAGSPAATGQKAAAAAAKSPSVTPTPPQPTGSSQGLALRSSRALLFDIAQVQGLAVTPRFFYVAASDPVKRTAFVYQVRRDTLAVTQIRALQRGARYHIGGVQIGGGLLWTVLTAEDRADGLHPSEPSVILGLDLQYLDTKRSFEVPDPIRAVAMGDDSYLYGVNTNATFFYEWSLDGRELRRVPNASGAKYQDLEMVRNSLVCAGEDKNGGVLDVVDPGSLSLLVRHRIGARSPGQRWISSRGFAFADGEFYFLPDDGARPALLTYGLDGVPLENYVPSLSTP
jgi:hypothetical protein